MLSSLYDTAWRWWLLHNPNYTLVNNFITLNTYVCIELNAHALIILLLTVREGGHGETFLPWKLGSQSCEKIFRATRSLHEQHIFDHDQLWQAWSLAQAA